MSSERDHQQQQPEGTSAGAPAAAASQEPPAQEHDEAVAEAAAAEAAAAAAEARERRAAEREQRRAGRGYAVEGYTGASAGQLREIVGLMEADLSEPYSVYTYRYFVDGWPQLAWLARDRATGEAVGAVVCKLDRHRSGALRGYIAMLAVRADWRKRGLGSDLVAEALDAMLPDADEVVLETECSNAAALALYGSLGFVRSKRLVRYYLNGADAFQLVLPLRTPLSLALDNSAPEE
eukprot:m51a1_g9880 putative n-acetyltransferase mak3-like protein (236) ;mRNA; r:10897-11669